MFTTIKGIYDEGKVILTEEPPIKSKADVMVTFLTEEKNEIKKPKRILDSSGGKNSVPDDFDEPGSNEEPRKGKQKIILGLLEGKIRLSDDFDEPLDDLKEYM